MKKKILSLVLSIALAATAVPISAFAETITVTNIDKSEESYEYNEADFELGQDDFGATTLIRKEDGYIFYPDTDANNGLKNTLASDIVPATSNGLELNKSVTQFPIHPTGEYTITLEAFTTGEVTVKQQVMPMDIVLVLDQSGSMYKTFGDDDTSVESQTRQYAMKEAVNSFIDSVYTSATKDDNNNELSSNEYIDHRIAIVTYENRTHIMSGGGVSNDAFSTVYEKVNELKNTINELPKTQKEAEDKLLGSEEKKLQTATHLGMEEANNILLADSTVQVALDTSDVAKKRNTVVILFSDGVPAKSGAITYNGKTYTEKKWSVFTEYAAHVAISEAYKSKTDYNASVYSIGIVNGVDANTISGELVDGKQITKEGTRWKNSKYNSQGNIAVINRFFNFLSSNSSDAQNLGAIPTSRNQNNQIEGWEITEEYNWENKKFFLTADNADDLKAAFTNIGSNVSAAKIDLPATTQVKDHVSEYFRLPEGFDASSDVKVYEVKSTGGTKNDDGTTTYTWDDEYIPLTEGMTIEQDRDNGIKVGGFDYNHNFVSIADKNAHDLDGNDVDTTVDGYESDFGSKLVIQFNIAAIDGFIGGNGVITNTIDSGVYIPGNEQPFNKFDPPETNVIVDYDITADDQVIYLGNQVMIYDMLELGDIKVEGILNEFVSTQFTIYADNALDTEGNFARKFMDPNGVEHVVYKEHDHYYYIKDGKEISTEVGGNYTIDGGKLYYQNYNNDGTPTDKYEILIKSGSHYYKDKDGEPIKLPDDQDDYYQSLVEATFHIPPSLSPEDASTLEINKDNISVQPSECTNYDLRCFAVPNGDKKNSRYLAEQLSKASTNITVHVIQPQIKGTDIWVDYNATVNLYDDGTSTTIWEENKIDSNDSTQDESNKHGISIKHEEVTQEHAHVNGVTEAPMVYYIYKDIHTGECYKLQSSAEWATENIGKVPNKKLDSGEITFEVVNNLDEIIASEKQFEIVAVQTLSSDGHKDIQYWSCQSGVHDKDAGDNGINIKINRYDVDIKKVIQVTQSEWEHYQQSFVFNITQETENKKDASESSTIIDPVHINTTEVVMSPSDFSRSDLENNDGTYTYTCTKTIKDLYAGLETIVAEDVNWSWRYTLHSAEFTDVASETISGSVNGEKLITVKYEHVNESNMVDTTGDGIIDASSTVQMGNYNTDHTIARYVNTHNAMIFIGKNNKPAVGKVNTKFVNDIANKRWLSDNDVEVNEFSGLTPIDKPETTGGAIHE